MVTGEWEHSPEQRKVCQVLETIAKEVSAQSIIAGEPSSAARERPHERIAPTLPPCRKLSPPASIISGATMRSFESVACASIPTLLYVTSPSVSACTSPTRTQPRPLSDLPAEPPPMHPDRKPTLAGVDGEQSIPSSPTMTGEFPTVYRSKSMHHTSAPPLPPLRRKRPESVQLLPISSGLPSPVDPPFLSPSRLAFQANHSLSRHHSLSGVLHRREALPEPIAILGRPGGSGSRLAPDSPMRPEASPMESAVSPTHVSDECSP